MRIAIISDTHDNIWELETVFEHLDDVDVLIHCGDLISPFVIDKLSQGFSGKPIHVVWGNNDGDHRLLLLKAQQSEHITIHGEFAELEIDGIKIAVNHYPEIARGLAASDKYDLVCYGHDHVAHVSQEGATVLLNPGEVMGLKGQRSFMIFDTETRKATLIKWQ